MRVWLEFQCRECDAEMVEVLDTANMPGQWDLHCGECGHTSGQLAMAYSYAAEHRPSWEREDTSRPD